MYSSANKTSKTLPGVQQKSEGASFFRKAGEGGFFSGKEAPSFFNAPIQAKLTVSTPDDPQEKEADEVADVVMRMPEPVTVPVAKQEEKMHRREEQAAAPPVVQRKEKPERKIQAKPVCLVQRSTERSGGMASESISHEAAVQTHPSHDSSLYRSDILRQSGRGPPTTSIPFEQTLASSRGAGSTLPDDTKGFMESRFNADFSGVRIHTDARAEQLATSVNAQAFAHGNNIYFNSGKFSPNSSDGRTLLAHELTHTIQQGASKNISPSKIQGKHVDASQSTRLETRGSGDAAVPDQKDIAPIKNPIAGAAKPGLLSNSHVDAKGNLQLSPTTNKVPIAPKAQPKEILKKEEPRTEEEGPEGKQNERGPVHLEQPANPDAIQPTPANGQSRAPLKISQGSTPIQLKRITSPTADPAFKSVVDKVKTTAQKAKKHDPAVKKVKEAQYAAKPPPNEKESKAKDNKVAEMDQQEPGVFDEAKFKAALRAKIAALQLNTLQEAENFKANNGAAAVKGDATTQVTGETKKAAGGIENKTKEAPAAGSVQGKEVGPAPAAAPDVSAPAINGQQAAPKPVPAEDVSLQKESKSLDKQMADAKVTEKQLAKSNEPKFTSALDSKKTAQEDAVKRPQDFRKDEKGIITGAQATATGVAKTQLSSIVGTHKQKMGGVLGKQQDAKAKDEADRAKIAADIEQKFTATKTEVEGILSKLDTDVTAMFDQGISEATKSFENYVDQEVRRFKIDRYLNQLGGSLLWAKDLLLGLPDEVNDIYRRGKERYVQAMDVVINKVAKLVVTQLNAAKKRIAQGKKEIKTYVDALPKNLQSIGNEAAKNIQSQFSELESSVNNKQNDLVDSLAAKYKAGLENVDKKIAEMKEANKGLVDKAVGAIKEVIDAIIEFKNMLLNVLARAAAAIELIIEDPIGFLGNLVAGVKQGIQAFVGNIATHLKNGLMGWLFGTMAQAGIQMPQSFDAKGILSLVLQVLGLTYSNIRARAVNIVGEKIVAGLEKAAEIFIVIKNEGIAGLWRFIKEKVEQLKDTVIDSIKSFVTEKIIVAGVTWLISLLNPASAFVKACKMIYDVIMFFVTRGSQIMSLVNAVIDSVTAIAKGNIAVAAKAVENALAKALPVAISFLASLLGLGGISEKIKEIIAKIQAPINAAIDWVINKAVSLVKSVAGFLSGGKDKDKKFDYPPEKQAKIDAGIIAMQQEQAKYLKDGKITKENAVKVAATVKSNHGVFSSFTVREAGTKIKFMYTASEEKEAGSTEEEMADKEECKRIITAIDALAVPDSSFFIQKNAEGQEVAPEKKPRYDETYQAYGNLKKAFEEGTKPFPDLKKDLKEMEGRMGVLAEVMKYRAGNPATAANNIAFGNYRITAGGKTIANEFVSVSSRAVQKTDITIPGKSIQFMPVVPRGKNEFKLDVTRTGADQDSERKFVHFLMTEVQGKLLDAKQKLDPEKAYSEFEGVVNIKSEMSPCSSCNPIIGSLRRIFNDKVAVNVTYGVKFNG